MICYQLQHTCINIPFDYHDYYETWDYYYFFHFTYEKRKQKRHAASNWFFLVRFSILLLLVHTLLPPLVFLCTQIDGLGPVALQGSTVHLVISVLLLGKVRKRAEATGQESGVCELFQDTDRLVVVVVWLPNGQAQSHFFLRIFCSSPWPALPATLTPGYFPVRGIFWFLLPVQFPSRTFGIYPTGRKANYER